MYPLAAEPVVAVFVAKFIQALPSSLIETAFQHHPPRRTRTAPSSVARQLKYYHRYAPPPPAPFLPLPCAGGYYAFNLFQYLEDVDETAEPCPSTSTSSGGDGDDAGPTAPPVDGGEPRQTRHPVATRRSDWVGMSLVGLSWVGLGWAGLGWAGLGWAGWYWIRGDVNRVHAPPCAPPPQKKHTLSRTKLLTAESRTRHVISYARGIVSAC